MFQCSGSPEDTEKRKVNRKNDISKFPSYICKSGVKNYIGTPPHKGKMMMLRAFYDRLVGVAKLVRRTCDLQDVNVHDSFHLGAHCATLKCATFPSLLYTNMYPFILYLNNNATNRHISFDAISYTAECFSFMGRVFTCPTQDFASVASTLAPQLCPWFSCIYQRSNDKLVSCISHLA